MRRRTGSVVVLVAVILGSVAYAAPQAPSSSGSAGAAQWKQFLAREVTPRFPDGLTVYETAGQWRDPRTATIGRERSRVLRIIVARDDTVAGKIAAVAEAYKRQFRQKSVGVVTREVCAAF